MIRETIMLDEVVYEVTTKVPYYDNNYVENIGKWLIETQHNVDLLKSDFRYLRGDASYRWLYVITVRNFKTALAIELAFG